MVPGNQVSQNAPLQPHLFDGMDCACRGVIDTSWSFLILDMRFGIVSFPVATDSFDVALEFFAIFPKVVP